MNAKKAYTFPPRVVPRLSRYYRAVCERGAQGWTSSKELSDCTGSSAAQIRRDLGYFGQFGQRGRGYKNEELKKSLRGILGLDQKWNVALFGVGHLGMALLGYRGFKEQGFEIVAAFDSDPKKAGRTFKGVEVHPVERCAKVIKARRITMAILTIPREVAQQVAEKAALSGVRAILNFAPANLKLPVSVKVRNIDMSIEIERLSFLVSRE
ncbi:MAG: redox-sensing transcriptional repressor Rex [Endomicrobiales bacterium]